MLRQKSVLAAAFLSLFVASLSPASDPPPQQTQAFLTRANLLVKSVRLVDNGDNDGFADPNETVSVFVTLRNNSGADRDNIVVILSSTDPTVDCIPTPVLAFGALAAGETRESATAATFRVANVSRTDPFGSLSATLEFQISGNDFGGTTQVQQRVLDLDLNVSGGVLPSSFTEGFEAASGFGAFTTMTLDTNMNTNTLSDGHRCQYNDPDFPNSNSNGNTFCYLGALDPANNAYDWHLHGTSSPEGGRAYLGNQSLHWGMHPSPISPGADTTRLKQLDAIRTLNPLNLGWNGVASDLTFKHQVGLADTEYLSGARYFAADRGIVQLQLAGSTGMPVGAWRKVAPYENVYNAQGLDNFINCMFDPTDDGSTEDDYFDPTDPERRLGPSSTCAPEFAFSRLGAIFWSDTFDPADIYHASDGPGLQGSLGPGTWVESKFDLSRYRGRRLRLRFLVTSVEVGNAVTWQQAVGWNPIPADDGWYIDDLRVTNTVTGAATVSVDTADRTGLPACGPVCGSVTASLTATPPGPVGPNQEVTLDASDSTTDQCSGGLHYRFRIGLDEEGVPAPPNFVLQEWGPNAVITQTSNFSATYSVTARCSTRPVCADSASVLVPFECPSVERMPFSESIVFDNKTQASWPTTSPIEVIRGDLGALRASGGQFNGSVNACLRQGIWNFFVDSTVPSSGQAFYYLVKSDAFTALCVDNSWGTGSPAELPGAGGDRDFDIPLDPDTCGSN